MSLWSRLASPFQQRQQNAGLAAPVQPQPPQPRPKTVTELEREMQAQAQAAAKATPLYARSTPRPRRFVRRLTGIALLVGIPAGAIWLVNLPYAPIRRPIADNAPILLLPSYLSMDNSYRQAIALTEQAEQLIDRPTSPADLELGSQKVQEAQAHLDKLPINLLEWRLDDDYWWYDSYLTRTSFNAAREKVAGLQAKVFQEQNAQNELTQAQQAIATAKAQYQQATALVDRQTAATNWQAALDQLSQIPQQTLAGRTAGQELNAGRRDWEAAVGEAASTASTASQIQAAQAFAWQAAKQSQNPPHSEAEWQEIEQLWKEAIDRLSQVPQNDVVGYTEAQKRMADYQSNLGEIQVRRQAEADAVRALAQAKDQIQFLLATTPDRTSVADLNRTRGQLQGIVDSLSRIQPGTTAYGEAQILLQQADNKIDQLR